MKNYLRKHSEFPPLISVAPHPALGIVVVIPAYHEPTLLESLQSLESAARPNCSVEILIVLNDAETSPPEVKVFHQKQYESLQKWAENRSRGNFRFIPLLIQNLPNKKSGVGMARKIGMDEAVRRFSSIERPDGIICCFDADSLCDPNYLQAVAHYFANNPRCPAISIRYEHTLSGTAFPPPIYQAIIHYESHLRYFLEAKRWAGFPYAHETIGSAMAVRASAYAQQGGMNKRKAGEDFYFLNKFIFDPQFGELNSTCIIPSPRISHRVPFGTGKAVGDLVNGQQKGMTYALESFRELRQFFQRVPDYYEDDSEFEKIMLDVPPAIASFLVQINGVKNWQEIKKNTADFPAFHKRFFRWFDPFLIMKYVHFCRDHFYPDVEVERAARQLAVEKAWIGSNEKLSAKELLICYREQMYAR